MTPLARRIAAVSVAAALAVGQASAVSAQPPAAVDAVPDDTVRVVAADDAASAQNAAERAQEIVERMSLDERAASIVMGHIPTTDSADLAGYMQSAGLGGFLLMGANVPTTELELREVTAALTPDAAFPPLLAIDEEGGDVTRLPWDAFPSALTLKNDPEDATERAFSGRAALVSRAGIDVNFGVVADVTDDPEMFIYRRALGTTPDAAAARVAAAVSGERGQVFSTLKHFPGHGAAAGDSHAGIPSTDMPYEEWTRTAAVPFAAGVDAGAPLLMFGHLRYTAIDAVPASLSARWHRIAREDLGFDGVAVTDDLGMLLSSGEDAYADPVANAVAAVAAGSDLVLMVVGSTAQTAPAIATGIAAAVGDGAIAEQRLEDAAVRVATLRLQRAAAGTALLPCADCAAVD